MERGGALAAIDILADAVGEISSEIAEVLAVVAVATSAVRHRLALPVEPELTPVGRRQRRCLRAVPGRDGAVLVRLPEHPLTQRRRREDTDRATLRALHRPDRMIGQLYRCLKQGTTYDESLAFGALPPRPLSPRLEPVSGE